MKVFAIDHGNGNVKAKSDEKEFVLPSALIREGDLQDEVNTTNGNTFDLDRYESNKFEGEFFLWGNDINKLTNSISTYGMESRYKDKHYRLLSEFAMAKLLPPTDLIDDTILVTGIPSREKGTSLEEDLIKVYNGGHVVYTANQSRIFKVSNVYVCPQPVGTVYDRYLDFNGHIADESYETLYVAVVDIGKGTTDLDGIKSLKRQKNDIDTIPIGMFNAYRKIADHINSESPSAKASPMSVEYQLLFGDGQSYEVSKRLKIDISKVVQRVYRETAEDLITHINQRWTNRAKFDTLILTGGSSIPLSKYLIEFENDFTLVDNPQMANVYGFYKYGQLRAKQLSGG